MGNLMLALATLVCSLPFTHSCDSESVVQRKVVVFIDDDSRDNWEFFNFDLARVFERANGVLAADGLPFRYELQISEIKSKWYAGDSRKEWIVVDTKTGGFAYELLEELEPELKEKTRSGKIDIVLVFTDLLPFGLGIGIPQSLMLIDEDLGEHFDALSASTAAIDGRGVIFLGLDRYGWQPDILKAVAAHLPITLLHEQGHLFGLEHTRSGIMRHDPVELSGLPVRFDSVSKEKLLELLERNISDYTASRH